MYDFSFFQCQFIPKKEIWDKAEQFRNRYWPENTIPVDMEYIIEARLNLSIVPDHDIRRMVSIDAYLTSNLSEIVVDYDQYMDEENRYTKRLRFSFAHEIGHYVLHRKIYEKFDITTPEEYYEFVTTCSEKEYRSFEWQANEFAGRLLVPRDKLQEHLQKIYEELEAKNAQRLWDESPDFVLERSAPTLCKPFGVSEDVIIRRVQEEGLVRSIR